MPFGSRFEAEIRHQPEVWRRLAHTTAASDVARAVDGRDVVLLGSGSSLFVAQLGALALRRRGIRAVALAAAEAPFDNAAFRRGAAIALSQSGETADVLQAVKLLQPETLTAITSAPASELARAAHVCVDVRAGEEEAVPASKSVTATAAVLLWAASLLGGGSTRSPQTLRAVADDVQAWLNGGGPESMGTIAAELASCNSIAVLGAGYGVPVACEVALKIKEASYLHAEGFSAGEFRHGSSAILDRETAIIGIVDDTSRAVVTRPLDEARAAGGRCLTIEADARGRRDGALGPVTGETFNTLAWLVAGQCLALALGRVRKIDSDRPRGLRKSLH